MTRQLVHVSLERINKKCFHIGDLKSLLFTNNKALQTLKIKNAYISQRLCNKLNNCINLRSFEFSGSNYQIR